MVTQALIVQLACLRLAAPPGWASVAAAKVAPAPRAAAAADIAATTDLVALTPPAALEGARVFGSMAELPALLNGSAPR